MPHIRHLGNKYRAWKAYAKKLEEVLEASEDTRDVEWYEDNLDLYTDMLELGLTAVNLEKTAEPHWMKQEKEKQHE